MRSTRLVAIGLLGAGLLGAGVAGATPPLQRKAKELGFPADDCRYCHSFDTSHMREKAQAMGISNLNCYTCHGNTLPKMGRALYNERGLWLLEQKASRKAEQVDVTWLAGYKDRNGDKPKNGEKAQKP